MNAQKMGRLLTVMAGIAAISMTAAQAAGALAPAKPMPTVTVKLGAAMLEEYHGGNPASRTTILPGGEVAQKAKSDDSGKKRS